MICANCKYEHSSPFCPQCGQRADVPKITFRSVFSDGFSTLTNMDKGFLFNVKNLLLRPKETVESYIGGRRKGMFNPISFLIFAVTFYLVGDALVDVKYEKGSLPDSKYYAIGYEAGRFVKLYFKYFWVSSVVWLSLATKLVFGKYNLAEHFAINSFVIGQATLAGLVGFLFTKIGILLFNPFIYVFITWMVYKIFKDQRRSIDIWLASIGVVLLFFIQLIIIIVLIGVVRSASPWVAAG